MPTSTNNVISGYVYYDGNTNGLYDAAEPTLANVPVALYNANGTLINSTVTNANGYYVFSTDNTINPAPRTVVQTLTVPWQTTDFSVNQALKQFNPNNPSTLGTLTSVTVQFNSAITSDIKVENTSKTSASVINGQVSGQIVLTGPGGLDLLNQPSANAGQYDASVWDGFTDFSGTSGTDFGSSQANATSSTTLTGAALNAFIGAGNVNLNVNTVATSHASGGGNVNSSITSYSTSNVTITYTYIPDNSLRQGNYTIVDTPPGSGFIDGWLSSNGTIIPSSFGTHSIFVQVIGNNFISNNNNFSELWSSSISGFVWADTGTGTDYNDGIRESEEAGIANDTITLTGTTVAGITVTKTTVTDGNGNYWFTNLLPGTYQVQQTPPAGWLDGKDMIGSLSGTNPSHAILGDIQLPPNNNAVNYNFGELPPPPPPPPQGSSLSGYVYGDISTTGYNDGFKEAGEAGIANTLIGLTYIDPNTQKLVSLNTMTDANGFYQFTNLAAGTYSIWETQPAGWQDGKDTQGTPGNGTTYNDAFIGIQLAAGVNGVNNNFGELFPNNNNLAGKSSLSGYVYGDISQNGYNNGIIDSGEPGIPNATVTLTGVTSQGQQVSQTLVTNANGFYDFTGLESGTYNIWEATPAGWLDGKDTQGTPGNGTVSPHVISGIQLPDNYTGINNNFGQLQPVVKVAVGAVPVAITPQFVPVQLFSKNLLFGTSGTPYQDPTLQAESTWVDGMYRTLLGRPSTYQEMGYWVDQLLAGTSRQDVVATLWNSPEHRRVEVDTFYQTYLGRTETDAEAAYWVNFLQQTQDETLMAQMILSSPEYINHIGGSANYVAALYANVFETDQIPAGAQAYWQNVINTTVNGYSVVARAFLDNPTSETLVIQAYYRQILGRDPTPSETSYWVNQMQTGQESLFGLGINLLAGDELYNIAAQAS